jgi:hypothetical protein
MLISRLIPVCGAALLLASAALAQTATPTTVTRLSAFTPVGIASSETMQVNVVNTAEAASTATAASCTGTISFFNSAGTIIGAATNFTVTTGQVFSATLPFSKVGASGTRSEIRGVVSLTTTLRPTVPCSLVSSLETYDTATGVTHVYMTGPAEPVVGIGYGLMGKR